MGHFKGRKWNSPNRGLLNLYLTKLLPISKGLIATYHFVKVLRNVFVLLHASLRKKDWWNDCCQGTITTTHLLPESGGVNLSESRLFISWALLWHVYCLFFSQQEKSSNKLRMKALVGWNTLYQVPRLINMTVFFTSTKNDMVKGDLNWVV